MGEKVPILLIDYDSEPYPVLGGPLCLGYREYIAGRKDLCRSIISSFLASVYASPARLKETSTERFVREIYRERGLQMPADKADADPEIVQEAAGWRYDQLHLPVLESILSRGYSPDMGQAITMTAKDGRYLVGDGKNRCSILAALGRKTVPNVTVEPASIKTIDFSAFEANAQKDPQWKSYRERWIYHERAIEIIKSLNISDAGKVLEVGSFGAGLVVGSDKMDLPNSQWNSPENQMMIWHDAREIPWPFEDGRYDLLIALRVWHHLAPVQRESFLEAKRIARNIIIECPEKEVVGVGITRDQFIAWNGGEKPVEECDMGAWGRLYLWRGFNA